MTRGSSVENENVILLELLCTGWKYLGHNSVTIDQTDPIGCIGIGFIQTTVAGFDAGRPRTICGLLAVCHMFRCVKLSQEYK